MCYNQGDDYKYHFLFLRKYALDSHYLDDSHIWISIHYTLHQILQLSEKWYYFRTILGEIRFRVIVRHNFIITYLTKCFYQKNVIISNKRYCFSFKTLSIISFMFRPVLMYSLVYFSFMLAPSLHPINDPLLTKTYIFLVNVIIW